ncbi:MAG: iron-binding protein hemerythrin [Clostridiales bacterium]|jgi:hemerythrin|nr:iron-binding protein hemerythrin [Clostridiales bacterium]
MFEMKDEYKLGIELIDNEHTRLFEIGEEVYQLLINEDVVDKYDKIVEIIEELKEYTVRHFKHEEEYMASIAYKRLFSQKVEHNDFIAKVEEIDYERIDQNQQEYMMELLSFLNDWLVNHILMQDMLIVQG